MESKTTIPAKSKQRTPKTNWKLAVVKRSLLTLQHIAPRKTSALIWKEFTRPGKSKFTPAQKSLIEKATITNSCYLGYNVVHYRWGDTGPKVLLSHGWKSKTADFRRIIEALITSGYVVEGIDMKAHGQSEGRHSALPEFRDILKNHYVKNGHYHAVIGYSLGGLAAGMMLSEITPTIQPKHLIFISAPPFARYFFKETMQEYGFNNEVFEEMCDLVEKHYKQKIDYFDLRNKASDLSASEIHLIYDENDTMVSVDRGHELKTAIHQSNFVQTKGLGHYKILTDPKVIECILEKITD